MDYSASLIRTYERRQTTGLLHCYFKDYLIRTFHTLELPYLDNRIRVSAISEGKYEVIKRVGTDSYSLSYDHFHILDVENRSWILIHRANYVSELKGCIAVGMAKMDINADGLEDTLHSKDALDLLYQIMPDKFLLKIIER